MGGQLKPDWLGVKEKAFFFSLATGNQMSADRRQWRAFQKDEFSHPHGLLDLKVHMGNGERHHTHYSSYVIEGQRLQKTSHTHAHI